MTYDCYEALNRSMMELEASYRHASPTCGDSWKDVGHHVRYLHALVAFYLQSLYPLEMFQISSNQCQLVVKRRGCNVHIVDGDQRTTGLQFRMKFSGQLGYALGQRKDLQPTQVLLGGSELHSQLLRIFVVPVMDSE